LCILDHLSSKKIVTESIHGYPITKIRWSPTSVAGSTQWLATTGDALRLWSLTPSNVLTMEKCLFNVRKCYMCEFLFFFFFFFFLFPFPFPFPFVVYLVLIFIVLAVATWSPAEISCQTTPISNKYKELFKKRPKYTPTPVKKKAKFPFQPSSINAQKPPLERTEEGRGSTGFIVGGDAKKALSEGNLKKWMGPTTPSSSSSSSTGVKKATE
ncbi:hypothetical protein HMI55_004803, partial [Coelomomyces lativittatus]